MNTYQDVQNNTQNTWGLLPNFRSKYYAHLSALFSDTPEINRKP